MTAKEYSKNRDEFLSILDETRWIMLYDSAIQTTINLLYLKLSSNSEFYFKTIEKAKDLFDRMRSDLVEIRKNSGLSNYHMDFVSAINEINLTCILESPRQIYDYNSENYFSKRISQWKEKENSLNKEIQTLKQSNEKSEEKEVELKEVREKIKKTEAEKDALEKKLDAQNNLESRISKAFSELKNHISPLTNEQTRLKWMFYIYASLCIGVFGILIYFEWSYLQHWKDADAGNWINYLPFYIPVPIVGALLWAFIYQMNRAQRQLMQVANVLFHIDYVEGLLLAINNVTIDINSSSEKICNVLDNMIKNYISFPDGLSEQALDKELSKDSINIHTFINLAKEIKEVIK